MQLLARFVRQHALVGLCVALIIASSLSFISEYRVIFATTGTMNDVVETLADTDPSRLAPSGTRTAREILAACGRTLTIAPRLKAEPALASKVRANCNAIAANILQKSPTSSRALAIQLLTANKLDNTTVATAQAAAPYEPWSLNIRLQAYVLFVPFTQDQKSLVLSDLKRAFESDWGKKEIARIYGAQPTMRDIILNAAESMGPKEQKRFLQLVRSQGRV